MKKHVRSWIILLLVLALALGGCSGEKAAEINGSPETTVTEEAKGETTKAPDTVADVPAISEGRVGTIYDEQVTYTAEQLKVQEDFDTFLEEIFKEEVTADSFSLHFLLENPDDFGIEAGAPTWGDFSYEDMQENKEELKQTWKQLASYDYSALNYEQKLIYDILKRLMENELMDIEVLFYEPFSPLHGLHTLIPLYFSEYDLQDKADIENCLALLEQTQAYVEDCLEYERYRAGEGYFLSMNGVEEVVEQCEEFLGAEENCVLSVLKENIAAFPGLTAEEISTYQARAKAAVEDSLIPAYQEIVAVMNELKGTAAELGGYVNYDGGQEYYEYLIESKTGSGKTVEELIRETEQQMMADLLSVSAIYSKDPSVEEKLENYEFLYSDPDEILQHLVTAIQEDYPKAVNENYSQKYVAEPMEKMCSPAFYMIPPLDNPSRNTIYINNNPDYEHMDLFTTLAHEGFPGHLYQTTYFYSMDPNPIRGVFSFNGYVEGWAQYIELDSYRWGGLDENLASFLSAYQSFNMGLMCRIDFGIHYEGWDKEALTQYLTPYGISDEEIVSELYYGAINDPAAYQPYYIGMLQFKQLRGEAETALGSSFSAKEFHKFLLEVGPAQFDVVKDRMNDWLQDANPLDIRVN